MKGFCRHKLYMVGRKAPKANCRRFKKCNCATHLPCRMANPNKKPADSIKDFLQSSSLTGGKRGDVRELNSRAFLRGTQREEYHI